MSKEKIITINPATEEKINEFPHLSDKELKESIDNCQEAFLEWKHEYIENRAKIIQLIGKELIKHKDDLAKLMTQEMGKLISQSETEVDLCAGICEYTAENGPKNLQNEERTLSNGNKGTIAYSPIGIVYGIQPWNYPSYQVIRYAIVNLMAGNAVLLKHASNVTGTGQLLEKIFVTAGLPKNLFKALIISHDQSDMIIKNKNVRGITLTGSSDAGRKIGQKATAELKKVVLELGSNDAYIVLEDADIKNAIEECVKGRIYNNGETCIAAKRFIVVEKVYETFKEGFVKAMKAVIVGDPLKEETELGPIAREDLRETLHEQVEESVKNGAEILCKGKIPNEKGFYYPVTVLGDVKPGQPAYDDELFGPVAALIMAKDEKDAMRIANDSKFGLGGGIFSKNIENAKKLAQHHFDTGMIFINTFGIADPTMPFGGVKNSGFGREHGGFGIKEFVNIKSIVVSK
ncbi:MULTISPECIES: NAD-dependent succinate-semialdehyde dehydrogenase [unclassified Polaribacter]|uniref:NAD-dependent succinate-semialdehyde dehydrogenase n=1 Tax=unclassified Polaribacter TaxID=196858 RepID=UPI0011BDC89F|nr:MULTISPECIES: NAD-dependent succinate-semialdehyde dehydrogenase [unclassified Polaribacter]TXD51464.1 NAD-dependent succinate-semialdehyde dehydrogenase [Polaribacter sp. IC063]TXD61808.1 NAD-dependent succinate-semialdehyde dehydrogenase [Polaribacter sp. IC066]